MSGIYIQISVGTFFFFFFEKKKEWITIAISSAFSIRCLLGIKLGAELSRIRTSTCKD